MAVTRFEDLPVDIIESIFDELTPTQVFHAFYNINRPINELVLSHKYHQNFVRNRVKPVDLLVSSLIGDQVMSLAVVSKWVPLIKLFKNIRKLTIVGWAYDSLSAIVHPEKLPHLNCLEYGLEVLDWNAFMGDNNGHYARQMIQCEVFALTGEPTVLCPALRSLRINSCARQYVPLILASAPNLVRLYLCLRLSLPTGFSLPDQKVIEIRMLNIDNEYTPFTRHQFIPHVNQSHLNLKRIHISIDEETTLDWLDQFLSFTGQVTHFSLRIPRSGEPICFEKLHQILTQRLPFLIPQKFNFEYSCIKKPFALEKHRNIGPFFQTMTAETQDFNMLSLLIININQKCQPGLYDDYDFDDAFEDELFGGSEEIDD